jgi:DnaJ-class molecular chaperone
MSDLRTDKWEELEYIEQCEACGGRGSWDTGPSIHDYACCEDCEGTGIDSWAVEQNRKMRMQNGGLE